MTVNFTTGAAGLRAGVSLGDANTIILPLTPRLAAAMGPANAVGMVSGSRVDYINELQVRAAHQFVYHRPGAQVGSWLSVWRSVV